MPCGYYFGFVAACIVVPIVVITLGVWLAKITAGSTAMLAVILGVLPGLVSAHGYRNIRELETGEFVLNVALAELPRFVDKDRLTLVGGIARGDLDEVSAHTIVSRGAPSERTRTTIYCEAFPIVPPAWTPSMPVQVWRFGETDPYQSHPLAGRVFRPSQPDELCRQAIDRAIAKFHLVTAPGAVYLEALVSESSDVGDNQLQGPFGVALLGGLWICVALFQAVRERIAERWRRRRTAV
jgi:hypothetical protein